MPIASRAHPYESQRRSNESRNSVSVNKKKIGSQSFVEQAEFCFMYRKKIDSSYVRGLDCATNFSLGIDLNLMNLHGRNIHMSKSVSFIQDETGH